MAVGNSSTSTAVLARLATERLQRKGLRDTITESDIAAELSSVSEKEQRAYLESYAEDCIQKHIRKTIENNYKRIQDEIQSIMDAHGIGSTAGENASPEPSPAVAKTPVPLSPSPAATAPAVPVSESSPDDSVDDGIRDEEPPEEYWSGEEEYVE